MQNNLNHLESEIKKEFQLERMILFSDAVFAIVITLMAIEIHLPESAAAGKLTLEQREHEFIHGLKHIAPTIVAYGISFFFVGNLWYRHLKLFAFLKTYDGGLVVRNLILLFCIGLFPFGASLISKAQGMMLPIAIYLGIILICLVSMYLLQHYVLLTKPELRNEMPLGDAMIKLKVARVGLITIVSACILMFITYHLITVEEYRSLVMFWIFPAPFIMKMARNKYTRQNTTIETTGTEV